jgi:hypothetical protein
MSGANVLVKARSGLKPQLLQNLKQRYQYNDWVDRNTLGENLFVWQAALRAQDLPQWEPIRFDTGPFAQPAVRAQAPALSQKKQWAWVHSTWRLAQSRADKFINVDLAECASRRDAHALLLRLLGEFQFIRLEQLPPTGPGDVAFSGRGGYVVLFARANLVVMIQNAGRALAPAVETAQGFDLVVAAKPAAAVAVEAAPLKAAAARKSPKAKSAATMPLNIPKNNSTYKIFSSSGQIEARANDVVYVPASSGSQEIEVYEVAGENVTRQVLRTEPPAAPPSE